MNENMNLENPNLNNEAKTKLDNLTQQAHRALDVSKDKTSAFIDNSANKLSSMKDEAKSQYYSCKNNLNDTVAHKPMQSLLLAAGAGMLLTWLFSGWRSHRSHYSNY